MSGVYDLRLPDFKNTNEALAFGCKMTRDDFILLEGARQALKRRFEKETDLQQKLFIAVDMQLLREAMEVAPDVTLAATI